MKTYILKVIWILSLMKECRSDFSNELPKSARIMYLLSAVCLGAAYVSVFLPFFGSGTLLSCLFVSAFLALAFTAVGIGLEAAERLKK